MSMFLLFVPNEEYTAKKLNLQGRAALIYL